MPVPGALLNGPTPVPAPTGRTRVAAVIGDPVTHSRSPAIHNAGFAAAGVDAVFVALPVAPADLATAVAGARAHGLLGLSVTMPHKAAVLPLLDEVEPDAVALDAVNCIVADGGRLVGANTDGAGLVAALRAEGVDPDGMRAVVLGAGGAGRSVVRALAPLVADLGVANRSPERRDRALALAGDVGRAVEPGAVADFDLVVNATSVGMGQAPGTALPLDPAGLHPGQVVVDLVYEPLETGLLAAAREAGATAIDGLGMLVHQAALAFERWTGVPAPVAAMREAADAKT